MCFRRRFNYLFLATLLLMLLNISIIAGGDGEYFYVMSKSLKQPASGFFDQKDIVAIYDDGATLVVVNAATEKIIKDNGLQIDSTATSAQQYSSLLQGFSTQIKFSKSQLISKFENTSPEGMGFYIVQFAGPVKSEWLDNLKVQNFNIFLPIPPYSYLIWGNEIEALKSRNEVKTTYSLSSSQKISADLIEKIGNVESSNPDNLTSQTVIISVLIAEFSEGRAKTIADGLKKAINISEKNFYKSTVASYYVWEIETAMANLPAIVNRPEVFYVEPLNAFRLCGERENIINIGQFDETGDGPLPGASYERWLADKKVNGAGVVIQLVDTGLDRGNSTNQPGTAHTDILGRIAGIVDYSGDNNGIDINGHGTLNAGIIAGNPFTRLKDPGGYLISMGVSPKSKIFATKISNYTNFIFKETVPNITQEARSYGASISLHPYGTNMRTFNMYTGEFSNPRVYSTKAAELDSLTRVANGDNINPQPMLFIVSAGNSGWFEDMFGGYVVDKTINDPAIAKNILSVGSFTGAPPEGGKRKDPAQDTSRGPLQDGRIAPSIVAPGIGLTGMASQSYDYQNSNPVFYPEGQTLYTRANGSSHAAAQIAGAAALFTDWWQRFWNYSSIPSPAMIKAAILNSAQDLQGGTYAVEIPSATFGFGSPQYDTVDPIPDMNQGWGGLNLEKLIPSQGAENEAIFYDQNTKTFDANGQTWETTIYSISQDKPLNITLCWTDPSAHPDASKALVNDIDLIVENDANQVFYGNSLKGGYSYPSGSADRVNNVERVRIEHPYGAYKVTVRSFSLNGKININDTKNKQDFALAVTGASLTSKKGFISFTAPYYRCDSTAGLVLSDADLKEQGTITLNVKNTTNQQNIDVQLTETPPKSGAFRGTFDLTSEAASGKLLAVDGDVLNAQYNDNDDGSGSPAQVSTTAKLDCIAPKITNFIVSDQTAFSLVLHISLNKAASGLIKWGTSTTSLNNVYYLEDISMNHLIPLSALNPCSIYYAQFELVDSTGNSSVDNNQGNYYSFQTLDDSPSFYDDFDANFNQNNFTHAAIQGVDDWTRIDDSANANSPTHSMKTSAVPSIKDIYLKTKNVKLKPNSRLTFYHKFSLEPGFDGAVAEISTDNGIHWRDLGNYITQGKYNAMISLFSGNPLMARLAWTYAWDNGKVEFRRSWIDLDRFRNQTVQIRFRLATDDSIILPDSAWYVDDVKISYDNDCANALFVRMDKWNYGPSDPFNKVHLRVLDPSLSTASSVIVKVSSETESAPESVVCAQTSANIYEGDILVKNGGTAAGDGYISCVDGNVITALYKSSDNGGTSNPDQASAYAFFYMPQLKFAPPQNQGVTKFHNDIQNALIFPFELSALGADIYIDSIKIKQTIDSQLDSARDILPDGLSLYEDTNEDKTFNSADTKLASASYDPINGATFNLTNYSVTRDSAPRLFVLVSFTEKVPFGTKFQFEIADLANDFKAKLQDGTKIIASSSKPAKGLLGKIVSRAILVNQNAPTIYFEDGETWMTAYHSIGNALADAQIRASRSKNPVEVWVAKGRYREFLLDPYGKALVANVEMYGGFGGDETNKNDPRKFIVQTILEKPHKGEDQPYSNSYYYMLDMYGGATLDGFHLLADNNMDFLPYNWDYPRSGAIYLKANSGKGVNVRNCIFHNFRETCFQGGNPNECPNSMIKNCVFAYLRNAPAWNLGYGSQFINCSFYNVGGWNIRGVQYYFTNCAWDWEIPKDSKMIPTIALAGDAEDYNRVRNCIIGNGVENNTNIYGDYRQNIHAKPKFINPKFLDFRLQPDSPAIDKGITEDNTNPALSLEPLDIRGNVRVIGDAPDIGAYENIPGQTMYYIKEILFSNNTDEDPVIFRPDQPVDIKFTLGSFNQPGDLVTLGGRLSMNDKHFKVAKNLGLFEPIEIGSLKQIDALPFAMTLTGNPPGFYNVKSFVDFIKTDGTNEILDTTFVQFSLPAFVDPVNGVDPASYDESVKYIGSIKTPFKTPGAAAYFLFGRHYDENMKILIAQGTVTDYLDFNQQTGKCDWVPKLEILGGYNPRTWERAPKVFETVWTGENQRRILNSFRNFAIKIDGFTIKDAVETAIQFYTYDSEWYYGTNEITNNTFQNINGANILYFYQYYGAAHMTYDNYWSEIGAPLINAGSKNGSALNGYRNTSSLTIPNVQDFTLSDFTIESWVNQRSLNPYYGYPYDSCAALFNITLSDYAFLRGYISAEGYPYIIIRGIDWPYEIRVNSDTKVDLGKWTHIAFSLKHNSLDKSKFKVYVYVNGIVTADWNGTFHEFKLNNIGSFAFGAVDGNMDEFRIWGDGLDASDIEMNRDKEISNAPGLIMAIHFNELTGTKSYSSVNGYYAETIQRYKFQSPTNIVKNNTFIDNKAICVNIGHTPPTLISNNIFKNNQERILYTDGACPFMQFTNNVLIGNSVPNEDYLLQFMYPHNHFVVNNTIVNNNAKVMEAMFNSGGWYFGIDTVLNNIILNNSGQTSDLSFSGRFVYNIIKAADLGDPNINPPWAENFSCTPTFDADGYHLLADSCARNKGPQVNNLKIQKSLAEVPDAYVYLDDTDNGILTVDGDFTISNSYGYNSSIHQLNSAPATATYDLSSLPAGKWEVVVCIPQYWYYDDRDIPYTITHSGGESVIQVNQAQHANSWFSLGTYTFEGNGKIKLTVTELTQYRYAVADAILFKYRPDIPKPGNTAPPSSGIMLNLWDAEKDIDGQSRPVSSRWDVGADQYFGGGDPQGALIEVNLVSGSPHLSGLPFTVELKLKNNYDNIPAGFKFRISYPTGAISNIKAIQGGLGASPTLGVETDGGDGYKYRELTAVPGNTNNNQRNPQLVKLEFTIADPYPNSLTINIEPAITGETVIDKQGAPIQAIIDDTLLDSLQILAPNPTANFSAVPTRGLINPDAGLFLTVYFQDASIGYITNWTWDFGDGTPIDTRRNPSHEYIEPGSYTITLTVEGPYGKSVKIKQDYVVASDPRNPPVANFTADPFSSQNQRVEGSAPLKVEFLDATNGPVSTYLWNFGDSTSANSQNPTHIYQTPGDYSVTLDVDGPMGPDSITKTNYIHVTAPTPIQANFTVDNPKGFAPHTVNFQNASSGANIQFFYYDFGDGNWSQESSTSHQYIIPGAYDSRLTIAGADGFSVSDPKKIEVNQAFPLRQIQNILLGKTAKTAESIKALDFNGDQDVTIADLIWYINHNK